MLKKSFRIVITLLILSTTLWLGSCSPGNTSAGLLEITGTWKLQDKVLTTTDLPAGTTFYYLVVNADSTAEIWTDQGLAEVFTIDSDSSGKMRWTHEETPRNPNWQGSWFYVDLGINGKELSGSFFPEDNSWLWEPVFDKVTDLPAMTYTNDFENGDSPFLSSDEWQIIDVGGNKVYAPISSDGNSDAYINIFPGENFTMQFEAKRMKSADSDEKCWMTLDFDIYTAPGGTHRSYWLNSHYTGSSYFGERGGTDISFSTAMSWDKWHTVKISLRQGKYFQFFLDETIVGEKEIDKEFFSGFKLEGNPVNGIWFMDNLSISLNEPLTAPAPDFNQLSVLGIREGEVFAMDVEGTRHYQLTHNEKTEWSPQWLPGREEILFIRNFDSYQDIYILNIDAKTERKLTDSTAKIGSADVSPDGTKIVFHSNRDNLVSNPDHNDIFSMNIDGTNITNLTNTAGFDDLFPDYSPDGTKLTFVSGENHPQLSWRVKVMDSDGSNITSLTPTTTPWDTNAFQASDPRWSSDGNEIVFQTARFTDSNHIERIYIVSATADGDDGLSADDPDLLYSHASSRSVNPVFNTDGSLIYFISNGALWTMNPDGSNPSELRPKPSKDGWYWNYCF